MFAVEVNLEAFRRVQFGGINGEADFIEWGENLTGAVCKMEIRAIKGTGTALATLNSAAPGSEGISITYDANYRHPLKGSLGPASIIRVQINATTLIGSGFDATPPESDRVLFYDIHVTPTGGLKRVRYFGTFTVKPGVTQ